MNKRLLTNLGLAGAALVALLLLGFSIARSTPVKAAVEIFASPVQGGCYIAGPSDCRIHVEPFTINLSTSAKMTRFQLISIQLPGNIQKVMYDWRPDQSNPVPFIGSTFSPSPVTQDFAVSCGKSYEVSLQGSDTSSPTVFNLGLTGQFTCPAGMP